MYSQNLEMKPAGEILSFMDLLDLDEEIIDMRAKNIMERQSFTNEHLSSLINLLQYKQLINTRENSECNNNDEYNFVGKLIIITTEENVDLVCKIIFLVLSLHPSSVVNKSEHLIQQILSDTYLPSSKATVTTDIEIEKLQTTLLNLKICVSILDAVTLLNIKLSLPYLDVPLEHIIYSKCVNLQVYFLTHTVSRFFEAITGYNILDRIWNFLKQSKENIAEIALQVLCCLSNYYLPMADESGIILFESDVIYHSEFWDIILLGLLNRDDNTLRKKAIYLAKRAIDCAINSDKSINVKSNSTFIWNPKNKIALKKMWDNYFILIDSLEEKQSNIVLPSLKLFDTVESIGNCWLTCAFNIGLCHDNAQVRYQCLQYRLQFKINNEQDAISILETINDINLFENANEYECLNKKLKNILKDLDTLVNVMKAIPIIKWSPVPLYHLTLILADIHIEGLDKLDSTFLIGIFSKILKIQCNNIIIRKAVYINMSIFIGNNCKTFSWKDYMYLYPHLHLEVDKTDNPFVKFVNEDLLIPDTKQFIQLMSFTHINIDFALTYFDGHEHSEFINFLNGTMKKINDINSRQYAKKSQYLDEVIFIVQLYKKTLNKQNTLSEKINIDASISLQTILQYVSSLLRCDMSFDIEKMMLIFEGLDLMTSQINKNDDNDFLLQLYKTTIMLLDDNDVDLEKKTLSIFVLNTCLHSPTILKNYKHELLDVDAFINKVINIKFNENINKDNSGRLRNVFYEKTCEIVLFLINNTNYSLNKNILDYIYNVLDRGGYGCLKWLLQIMNKVLPKLLDKKDMFDLTKFLNRIWNEIEELKSNNQYTICIKQFIIILTQETVLQRSEYNNIVVSYCSQILEYAAIKNTPLYYLVEQINKINISAYSHMVYVLSEILLYAYIPKKDHRIAESVTVDILEDPRYGINKQDIFFNYHIKVLAVSVLSKINDTEILNTMNHFIMKSVDNLFKNKQRYHGNSLHERSLLSAIQNLLFIFFKNRDVDLDTVLLWVMDLLGRIPHQPFVRTYFEWYIALFYYIKGNILNDDILNQLKAKNVPIHSQSMIFYFIVTHKLKVNKCTKEEFNFVMDFLLSNIMGPIYSIRLYAQYLSTRIFDANSRLGLIDSQKYSYTIDVVKRTLTDASELKDKSFMKLLNDHFVHVFDIVEDLTPLGIYYALPKLYDINDIVQTDFMENSFEQIEKFITENYDDRFLNEWKDNHKYYSVLFNKNIMQKECNERIENYEETSTIQKKYVPWKNMSDIDVCSNEVKKDKSDLIVVASLIDKLPNLGGMARTSEVFGVQTYVVDSLRRLQDKQFQGLSVSAERWVHVEEVRPGNALKDFLMKKKTEGYSIVAAEQTSSSSPLQNFKFPKKTLLLLGHEKEGVPCDLLPLMDHCIEIPQQGVIRSLNVHVTAAIFIWEYARQNML